MTFDLQAQTKLAKQEDEGTDVHIHGVDDEPLYYKDKKGEQQPVTITVAGIHSDRYRQVEQQLRRRKLKSKNLTPEAIYNETITKVASSILKWAGFTAGPDTEFPFTVDNARVLLKKCPWVLSQLTEAMEDRERFFTKGSSS